MPTTFIIDQNGKIAFIGDPSTIDKPLEEIVNGKYSIANASKKYKAGLGAEQMLEKFNATLKENKIADAITLGNKILSGFEYVNPKTYLMLGANIAVLKQKPNQRLLDIALKAAKQGVLLTQFESPGFLDVLASVYAAKGDYVQAVITETVAVSLSDGGMKDAQLQNLEKYRSVIKQND